MHSFSTTKSTTTYFQIWLSLPIMVGIPLLRSSFQMVDLLMAVALTLIIVVFVILPFKRPLHIRIDADTRQLYYVYQNCFGVEQMLTIDLKNVQGYYESKRFWKLQANWRLVLYNQKGLYNKLTLEEGNGYTKEQLDSIMQLVEDCREA